MRSLLPTVILTLTLGAAVVGVAQPRGDATRIARSVDQALLFVPEPDQVRAASLGFAEPLSDLFWIRTVLVFGERFGTEEGSRWNEWLRRMIMAVYTLDPKWRTPYFYGGTLLRVNGDIEGSDIVFTEAHAQLPDDPFFPFSLGMNAYLYRDDPASAARLLAVAAALPDAPSWYAAGAAAMRQQSGDRASAIRYLEEVRASTTEPGVIADTERQLGRLRHNELVDGWADACRRWRDEHGPLTSPAEIERLGFRLPENPRGDEWVVGRDGVVRSAGAEAERRRRRLQDEWRLVGK